MDVRFGSAPALFCIVAPSPERAYAILYELAVSLVDIERAYAEGSLSRGEGGCNGTVGRNPPPSGGVNRLSLGVGCVADVLALDEEDHHLGDVGGVVGDPF
jgi:hypothetical protein